MYVLYSASIEHASTSDQVATAVLQAITSPEPKLRYPVGFDAAIWLEKKGTMTDDQIQEYMKTSMATLVPSQK